MKSKLPIVILIFCIALIVYSFIGVVFLVKSIKVGQSDLIFKYISLGILLIGFVIVGGILKLKKWGIYSYFGLVLIMQMTSIVFNKWTISLIYVPIIFLVITLIYYKKFK